MPWWPASDARNNTRLLESRFGKLELRVLEALWHHGADASVRDLQPAFPAAAYTTLMTTLDRLYRKQVVDRVKSGRAFLYRPRYTREALESGVARNTLSELFGSDPSAMRPILSTFVDAVSDRDKELLDELARLVLAKQQDQGDER